MLRYTQALSRWWAARLPVVVLRALQEDADLEGLRFMSPEQPAAADLLACNRTSSPAQQTRGSSGAAHLPHIALMPLHQHRMLPVPARQAS